jgi:hypothetical protein
MDLLTRVPDSRAEAQETLGDGHERQGRTFENGENGCDQLGVRFKRAPVAPTIGIPANIPSHYVFGSETARANRGKTTAGRMLCSNNSRISSTTSTRRSASAKVSPAACSAI